MESILKSWGNTLRFIIVLFIIFFAVIIIINKLSNNTQFNIDYTNDKTLITIIDKKNVIANSVLSACDCWANTGIEIRPGEEYEIKVLGKIHTTADKMIKDAEDDVKPRFDWVGPEGAKDFRIRNNKQYFLSDSLRKTLLLFQNAKVGQVLFYFQKTNSKKPNCEMGLSFFIPDSVLTYESEKGLSGKNDTKDTWFVWASVNDMLLRDFQGQSNKIAYLGGAINDTLKTKLNNWQQLVNENYNRLWFDDNFGNFVISAKIIKPIHYFDFW